MEANLLNWSAAVDGLAVVVDGLPGAVQQLRPYLDSSFFSDAMIETAYDSFAKCGNLAERSRLAFAEVEHQLGGHDARSIDALGHRAVDLAGDLETVGDSLVEIVR